MGSRGLTLSAIIPWSSASGSAGGVGGRYACAKGSREAFPWHTPRWVAEVCSCDVESILRLLSWDGTQQLQRHGLPLCALQAAQSPLASAGL